MAMLEKIQDREFVQEYINIPVRGNNSTVQVFKDELPSVILDVVDVLKAEVAPLDIWLKFAVEYYRQGKKDQFREILREIVTALNPETERFYSDDPEGFKIGRLRILNALAADALKRSVEAKDKKEQEGYSRQTLDYLNAADRIDTMSELTWVGKGNYYLHMGDMERAKYYFGNARKKRGGQQGQAPPNIPAALGEACILFHEGNYKAALSHYCDVLRWNPRCGAGIRVGLGLCCYKLGQLSRAKAAFERALELDGKCVEALVGSAILELGSGDAKAKETTQAAISTISLAHHFDSTNSMVLNHLAHHYFWHFSPLKVTVSLATGSREAHYSAASSAALEESLSPGDLIKIGKTFITRVDPSRRIQGGVLTLADAFPLHASDAEPVYIKDYRKVFELAREGAQNTEVPEIKAESNYIMGRVYHAQGRYSDAKFYYSEACKLWSQLAPAQYGLAQMLVHEGKVDQAIAALDLVLKELPDNQEALVLQGALYSQKKERKLALAKYKSALEMNPYLSEVWVAQAQVFQEDPADYELALASYSKALNTSGLGGAATKENYSSSLRRMGQAVWANMAVLYEYVDRLPEAMSAYENALDLVSEEAPEEDEGAARPRVTIAHPANKLFWAWREIPGVTAQINPEQLSVDTSLSVARSLRAGDRIRVGPTFVTEVLGVSASGTEVQVRDCCIAGLEAPVVGTLYKKELKTCLKADSVSITYNLALLHEKQGHHEAAQELYCAILAEHPSYINCYMRLSCIARDRGDTKEAGVWFSRAMDIDPDNADSLAYSANLGMRCGEWASAQKSLERIMDLPGCRKDSYAVVSLGNVYFSNLDDKGKYDKHIGYASNFFHQVVSADPSNAYAANGLGMVLAEKAMLDQAKDVFARVREVSAEVVGDVWINLAHVYLAQNKHSEAIRLYQNCLKKFHGGRDAALHLYLAHAHFDAGSYKHCMRTLLKALHICPSDLQLWYNLAVTEETFAVTVLQKDQKGETRTLTEVQHASDDLKGASQLFTWLSTRERPTRRQLPYTTDKAKKHASFCEGNINSANQHLQHEKLKEHEKQQDRLRRQQRLQESARKRQEEQTEADRKKAESLADQQKKAEEMMKKSEGLIQSWKDKKPSKGSKAQDQSADDAAAGSSDVDSAIVDPPKGRYIRKHNESLKEIGLDSDSSSDESSDGNVSGGGSAGTRRKRPHVGSDGEDGDADLPEGNGEGGARNTGEVEEEQNAPMGVRGGDDVTLDPEADATSATKKRKKSRSAILPDDDDED
jgi:RNA polymerase-associated protein CTR9